MKKRLWIITFAMVIIIFGIYILKPPSGEPKNNLSNSHPAKERQISKTNEGFPIPDHVVIVIEENHSYDDVINNSTLPYINYLANEGIIFTNSHGVTHPSQPNYMALFSGDVHGITSDQCPHTLNTENLASRLFNIRPNSDSM